MDEKLVISNVLRPRVLYVDDDEDSREMLSLILKGRGIETKAVGTAREALSAIPQRELRIVFVGCLAP
jgi:CheY-like chemotaxis protein